MTAAVTMFVIAILLVSSTPIIAQDEGGLRGLEEYSGEHHTVRYHLDAPDGVNSACNDIVNDIGDGNSGDPYVDVVYYGSIVSTEYNPQLWASTIPTREDVDWNWLEIKDYSVGSTAVFIGWHYGWEDSGSTHYPGEVLSKYDLSNAESGILNVYATWSTVDNVQTVTSESSASNIQTAINGFVGGTAYTNFILVRAGDAVNLSGKTLTTGKPVTIRTEPVEGFSSVGRLEGNGSTTVKAGAMLIIDDIGLKISTPDSKHGTTNFGIVGNGYPLIIGTGIMSYYGFGLGDTFGQNTSKGERNGYPTLRGGTTASSNALGGDWPVNVYPARDTASDEYGNIASVLIVHSGTWSNIIGGNSQSVTNGSVYSVLRSVTVLDTYACGGTASNGNYTIKGSTYGYLVNANVVADSYQQRAMGLETIPYKYTPDNAPLPGWPFNIDSNNGDSVLKRVFIYESTVITGGGGSSGTGNVMKNTNVYISGTSTVWDAQAAGRSEKSPVAGTGLIELSGKAVSQHILCGSATDGASSDTKIIDSTRIVVKDSAMAATLCGGGYDTWSAPRGASMMNGGTVEIEVTGGTVCDVFGGGFRALVGTSSKPIDSIAISISGGTVLGNVYGGGSGGLDKMKHVDDKGTPWSDANQTGKSDSTGKSRVYVKDVSIEISDDAHVLGNVYGGGKSVPTISSYYNYSYLSDASLESDVAALYCNSVSISVSGNAEVDGDVFGGGRGVVVPTSSEQEEWTEYTHTLVMTPTGAKYIEWVTKSGSSLEQSCTFLDGNYSGYAKVSIPLTAAASPTVEIDIEDTASARSVYGGGARSKTVGTGNIDIEIKGDASVEDSVFGGGMMESLNAASISIGVSGTADVGSCVYGAGAEGPVVLTGNVYISTSGTGVTIGDSVFGGGFKESLSAMAVSIDIGGGT
ncbi:MAG: hypothetical protein J5674_04845, partial [Candidatus Methanomethylophilaceae archaeon]|nr:hypothetical protein [Candidatus Methanomethylophilaceae archaeon]